MPAEIFAFFDFVFFEIQVAVRTTGGLLDPVREAMPRFSSSP